MNNPIHSRSVATAAVRPGCVGGLVLCVTGAFAFGAGFITLVGWFAHIPRLTDWFGHGISMFPNTAVCAVLSGLALLIHGTCFGHSSDSAVSPESAGGGRREVVLAALGAVVAGLAGLTLLQHLVGVSFGIDTLLVTRPWGQAASVAPMRMGPPASLSFTLVGVALALLGTRHDRAERFAAGAGLVVTTIAALSLIGYLYGVEPFYLLPRLTGIALPTGLVLFAVGGGLIAAAPRHGLAEVLRRDDAGGHMVRRLLVPLVAGAVILGWLRITGQSVGLYDAAFGTAARTLVEILLIVALLWWAGNGLSRVSRSADAAYRKAAEGERAYQRMVRDVRDHAIITSDATGLVTSLNAGGRELLGWAEDDLVGCPGDVIFTPEDRAEGAARAERERAVETGRAEDRRWHIRRDGTRFWASGSLTAVRDEAGELVGFIKIMRDETAHKRAEDELRRSEAAERAARSAAETARAAAEEAGRAKDDFLAVASHELRTPLSAILGFASLLERSPAARADPKVAEAAAVIYRNAKAQAQVIEDILDANRIVTGKLRLDLRATELCDVVSAAVETVRAAADAKGVRIIDRCERVGLVSADPDRMQQVVWNLLSNAVKFTPRRGEITVTLRRERSLAVLCVSDSGAGIEADLLPHVFERFRTGDPSTTRRHGGLGLGLSIVRNLVEMHGGTVRAESEGPGHGARFTVELPLVAVHPPRLESLRGGSAAHRHAESDEFRPAGRPGTAAPAPALDCPPSLQDVRALVVDDEPDARRLVQGVLVHCGADVTAAGAVHEAIAALRAGPRPDVMVSDVGMPEADGYAMIAALRDHERAAGWPRVPAAALTAYTRVEDRLKVLDAGFDLFIPKPVEPQELATLVGELVGRHGPGAPARQSTGA